MVQEGVTHKDLVAWARANPPEPGEVYTRMPYKIVKQFKVSPNRALAAWKEASS